jgi:phosphatidylserine/phosphatidylglycerophosphate/cardiolipin synthase-like enzyme
MVSLARGGMKIRGVLDPVRAAHDWAAPSTLEHPNIDLLIPKKSGVFKDLRKLHHKLMVIDEQVVVAGSFNYTEPANDYNDENIFVLGSVFPKVGDITVDAQACRQLANHMKEEIERIIAGSKKYMS